MITVTANGNLGKDAELKQVGDIELASFSIAINKFKKGEKVTEWYNCNYWRPGKLIEYLKQGQSVVVSGEMEQQKYNEKYYYTINCFRVELVGKKENAERNETKSQSEQNFDDLNNAPDDNEPPF